MKIREWICSFVVLLIAVGNFFRLYESNEIYRHTSIALFYAIMAFLYYQCIADRTAAWIRSLHREQRTELFGTFAAASAVVLLCYSYKVGTLPFAGMGDGLRDSARFATQIISGQISNPWEFGSYDGFSFLLPWINIPFELLYPGSNLSFRLTATVITYCGFVAFFFLSCKEFGIRIGSLAAIAYGLLPLVVWHARDEVLVALNPFILIPGIAWLACPPEKGTPSDHFKAGFLGGFSTYLHVAAAIAWLEVYGIGLLSLALWGKKPRVTTTIKSLGFVAFGYLLALAPRYHVLQHGILRAFGDRVRGGTLTERLVALVHGYREIVVRLFIPTCDFHAPASCLTVVSPFIGLLSLTGLLLPLLIAPRKAYVCCASAAVIAIILVSHGSASTRGFAPHALIVCMPFLAFLFGSGLQVSSDLLTVWIRRVRLRTAVTRLLGICIFYATVAPAWKTIRDAQAYESDPSAHLANVSYRIGQLVLPKEYKERLCIGSNDSTLITHLDRMHTREQVQYYSDTPRLEYYLAFLTFDDPRPRTIELADGCDSIPLSEDKFEILSFGRWEIRMQH